VRKGRWADRRQRDIDGARQPAFGGALVWAAAIVMRRIGSLELVDEGC